MTTQRPLLGKPPIGWSCGRRKPSSCCCGGWSWMGFWRGRWPNSWRRRRSSCRRRDWSNKDWEALATAAEADKAALAERLAKLQREAQGQGGRSLATLRQTARQAAARIDLDEAATRLLIDEQLCQAGWEAGSCATARAHGLKSTATWRSPNGPPPTGPQGCVRCAASGGALLPRWGWGVSGAFRLCHQRPALPPAAAHRQWHLLPQSAPLHPPSSAPRGLVFPVGSRIYAS